MIKDTLLFSSADLEPLLDEALSGREPAQFVADYLNGLAGILTTNPRHYRSLGPYWWPLKAMLIDKGLFAGSSLENGTLQHYTMETPELTLVAAWAYQQGRIDEGKLYSCSHQLELPEGELYEYELTDLELERAIMENQPLPNPAKPLSRAGAKAFHQNLKAMLGQ